MLLYESQWWKWLYSLETILYKKNKLYTILNNESVLLILIMEIIGSTKIWYTRVL